MSYVRSYDTTRGNARVAYQGPDSQKNLTTNLGKTYDKLRIFTQIFCESGPQTLSLSLQYTLLQYLALVNIISAMAVI